MALENEIHQVIAALDELSSERSSDPALCI